MDSLNNVVAIVTVTLVTVLMKPVPYITNTLIGIGNIIILVIVVIKRFTSDIVLPRMSQIFKMNSELCVVEYF